MPTDFLPEMSYPNASALLSYPCFAASRSRHGYVRLTHPNPPATVLPMPSKFCPRCDTDRPLEDFPVNNARADGRGGWCRLCMRQATRKWKAEHPETNRLHAKIYHANKQLKALEHHDPE